MGSEMCIRDRDTIFAKFFEYYTIALVEDPDKEDEPSLVDNLQVSVVQALVLYGDHHERRFLPHVETFTQLASASVDGRHRQTVTGRVGGYPFAS